MNYGIGGILVCIRNTHINTVIFQQDIRILIPNTTTITVKNEYECIVLYSLNEYYKYLYKYMNITEIFVVFAVVGLIFEL